MESWGKAIVIKGTQGTYSEWLSAPCGEKASVSENVRLQTRLHAGLRFYFVVPAWVKPEFEKSAQSGSWLSATAAHRKRKYECSLEIASSSQGPADKDQSNVRSQLNITQTPEKQFTMPRVEENEEKREPELDPNPELSRISDTEIVRHRS